MSILERVYNYVTGRFIKSVNYQTILGAGNIEGGGGGGVSKEYVDEQDEALSARITTNASNIETLSTATNQLQTDLNELEEQVETLETEVENLDNDKADKAETYNKTEVNNLLDNKADKSTTYTKTETDNKFQEKITDSDETSSLTDSSKFSLVDSSAKTNKKWAMSTLWTYIKGKITSIYYPVGTVIFNTGTNPSSTFGGTWSLYATGTKALYLDSTAGTTVNEELPNPNITLANNGKKTIGTSGKGNVLICKYNSSSTNAWGIDYGSKQFRVEEELSAPIETASNHSHTVTIGNSTYKTGGTVKAAGITICAWKRTA